MTVPLLSRFTLCQVYLDGTASACPSTARHLYLAQAFNQRAFSCALIPYDAYFGEGNPGVLDSYVPEILNLFDKGLHIASNDIC
jgi:hypothetical protein